ncbi:MAG: hydrogenase maturation protease, partial [Thiotrichales bacterium]|nr:hydrogenase maturation protease [Thiotrichales bacterium]
MNKILVLGLGNTLLGDEGVGVRVVELLKERGEYDNVEFMDGGTLSFSLAGAIADSDQLIVIDA